MGGRRSPYPGREESCVNGRQSRSFSGQSHSIHLLLQELMTNNRSFLIVAFASTLAACTGTTTVDEPFTADEPFKAGEPLTDGEPYIRGPVEAIAHHATASNILVRAAPGSPDRCGISATVNGETRYLRQPSDDARNAAALSDIDVGDTVEVYVSGPVAESCPVQAYAAAVVLLGPD
jgi:hypothetical protein